MSDLSILIPARNEMWLKNTIEDLLMHIEGNTDIIVVCDGNWPDPPIKDHPKVTLVYHESIGQRAATNEAARISKSKYLMKVDAHCAFDKGFDTKMLKVMQPDWTMVPVMRNLHVFDWTCRCGWRKYQGPTPPECPKCQGPVAREVVWNPKTNPQSTSYCFDSTPHFQYFRQFKGRPGGRGHVTETMSLQGSCWMLTRDKYFELDICDESFGSWGSQGIEVAVKTWLSGGKCMVNQKTWYAHLFRTQGGDFGFPYKLTKGQTDFAQNKARELFFTNSWPKQIYPLSWLLERFWPVPGWTQEDLNAIKQYDHVVQQKAA